MNIKSSAFNEEGNIPVKYTCDGGNTSPELSWSDAPEGTKSFALIVDDPDAPSGVFVHWVVYNIPAGVIKLPEGTKLSDLIKGAVQGTNGFGKNEYGGPCPPSGTHRYYFKLYALDSELQLKKGAKKEDVIKAMREHILAEAQLMGKYERKR